MKSTEKGFVRLYSHIAAVGMYWHNDIFADFVKNPDFNKLTFEYEPENSCDKYAIAIKYCGKTFSYVPQNITSALGYYSCDARRRIFISKMEFNSYTLVFDICLLKENVASDSLDLEYEQKVEGNPYKDSIKCKIPELVRAIKEAENNNKIRKLILGKRNLNVFGEKWGTPLIAAIKTQNLTIVKMLVSLGASGNVKASHLWVGKYLDSPPTIAFAAAEGNTEILSTILEKSRIKTSNLVFAKYAAECLSQKSFIAEHQKKEILKGIDIINAKLEKRTKQRKYIISHDADNIQALPQIFPPCPTANILPRETYFHDSSLDINLLEAAKAGNFAKCKSLLKQGANPNANTDDFCFEDKNVLMLAANSGNLDLVKFLVEDCNVDVNSTGGEVETDTAIIYAAKSGNLEMVKYLLSKGADIDASDIEDYTPLWVALTYGHLEIMKYLIKLGANINRTASFYDSPIEAANLESPKILRYLVEELGLGVNENSEKESLFFHCANYGSVETMKYLLDDLKLDIDFKNKSLETLLFDAESTSRKSMVKFLLSRGAKQ